MENGLLWKLPNGGQPLMEKWPFIEIDLEGKAVKDHL